MVATLDARPLDSTASKLENVYSPCQTMSGKTRGTIHDETKAAVRFAAFGSDVG
jgi:hypothetical protein